MLCSWFMAEQVLSHGQGKSGFDTRPGDMHMALPSAARQQNESSYRKWGGRSHTAPTEQLRKEDIEVEEPPIMAPGS